MNPTTPKNQEPLGGDLHRAIMNLPCDHRQSDEYKRGHRDARHAAAELVSAALSQQAGAAGVIPDVLFDGKAVYDEITAHLGRTHCYGTGAVSTVLDAVVRLMRKQASTATSTKPADADNYHATIRAFDERMRDPLNKVLAERGGAAGVGEVKPWRERMPNAMNSSSAGEIERACMEAETADLRAQLAQTTAALEAQGKLCEHYRDASWEAARLQAQRQGSGEPVRYEHRMRAPNGHCGEWFGCNKEFFDKFSAAPDIGDGFAYQTRALYEHAAPQAQGEPVATVEAGKFANRLQWVSDDAMARTLVGSKLYLGPAAQADEVRDAWQPIATAPHNKLLLLAYEFDGPGDWRIKVGGYWDGGWEVFGASWMPTRWMPLPSAPKVSDRALRTTAADNQEG